MSNRKMTATGPRLARLAPLVLGLLLGLVTHDPAGLRAQDATEAARKKLQADVIDRVHRARRLREYDYPMLARTQLEAAKKLDPKSREMLVEYVRLYLTPGADVADIDAVVAALLELYPEDYEACFELARLQYQSEIRPLRPDVESPEKLKAVLQRLADEMKVYRDLATFIAKPGAELPAGARGRPALSLAWLARCAKLAPDSPEVMHLAARELYFRAQAFHEWAIADEALGPFGPAALELYRLAEPLLRACLGSQRLGPDVSVTLVELLVRTSRFKEARAEAAAAELLSPRSLRLAGALGDIAESEKDIDLLISALGKINAAYGNTESQIDLRIARRIKDKGWSFDRWLAHREAERMPPVQRRQAWAVLLKDEPEFAEIRFQDALMCLQFAENETEPGQIRQWLALGLSGLEACSDLGKDFAEWHVHRGSTLWMLGRYADAAASYDKAAALAPDDAEPRKFAQAARDIAAGRYTSIDYKEYRDLLAPGDFTDKHKGLSAIVKRSPNFLAAQSALAKVCHLLGDFETAFSAARAASALDPASIELAESAAQAAMECAKYTEATELFEKVCERAPQYLEGRRQRKLCKDLAAGSDARRRAFALWRQAQRPVEGEAGKRRKLEEALSADPTLPEVLIDLAVMERVINPERSAKLLENALLNSRDEFTKSSAHRERGRLYLGMRKHTLAVREFETAYETLKADGADLLLAALALSESGNHTQASAAMTKLLSEVPHAPTLRPRERDVRELDLLAVRSDSPRRVAPDFDPGQKVEFTVQLAVQGEGGGQRDMKLSLEYTLAVHVLQTPQNGGLWVLRLTCKDAPGAEFAALNNVSMEVKISPWFGLVEEPRAGVLEDVLNPAIQALCEAMTCGIGDAAVPPPLVWKNVLTKGPPHFGGQDSAEASALTEALGEQLQVERRAFAGRRVGDQNDPFRTELVNTRTLMAKVKLTGPRRAILESGFQLHRMELTKARDDVLISDLSIKLLLK